MSRVTTTTAAALRASDNWSAGFHFLLNEHRAAFEELMRLDVPTLVALAKALPFDEPTANAVVSRNRRISKSELFDMFDSPPKVVREMGSAPFREQTQIERSTDVGEGRRWKMRVAAYAAAASHWAKAKISEELLALTRQKLEVAKRLKAVYDTAREHSCPELMRLVTADPGGA